MSGVYWAYLGRILGVSGAYMGRIWADGTVVCDAIQLWSSEPRKRPLVKGECARESATEARDL